MPVRLTTTLHDLITAIHSVTESLEEELVIARVIHGVRADRITFLSGCRWEGSGRHDLCPQKHSSSIIEPVRAGPPHCLQEND